MKIKKTWLKNKRILLTGASSGIGREICHILINQYGCYVIGIARREERLQELKKQYPDSFNYIVGDVSKFSEWQRFYNELKNNPIDVLINNSGTIHGFLPIEKIDYDEMSRVMDTNFYSIVYGVKTFISMIKSVNGGIINVASASAILSIPGMSIYSASKSAVSGFTQSISRETKKTYIGCVYPGFVKTELFSKKNKNPELISDKDANLFKKFSMNCSKAAKKIVKGIIKKKRRIVIGIDARLMSLLQRLMPSMATKMVGGLLKKSKRETFKDVFNK